MTKGKMLAAAICCLQFMGLPAGQAAGAEGPAVEAQLQATFPDAVEAVEEYALNRRLFKGYQGRGTMLLDNHGVRQVAIYINGHRLPLAEPLPDGELQLAIGGYCRDGDNTLKVLQLQPADGKLTIRIPYPTLVTGSPAQVGMSAKKLAQVDEVLEQDVKNGFPGAVLFIVKDGRIVKESAYGWAKLYEQRQQLAPDQREPMRTDTMFDLASNTKMYAVILSFMKLMDEGKVNPEDPIVKYLPEYRGEGRENIRIRDVMTHSAGYAPLVPFHKPQAGAFYSRQREKTIALLPKVPLTYPVGTKTVYSDTDYMLLAALLERITGERLDVYTEEHIYQPLGLSHTVFNPLQKGFQAGDFAATEPCGNTRSGMIDFPGIRTYTLQGEAHDELAWYSMGGVSGHAGLFSRPEDMAVLAQLLLNRGGYGKYRLCRPEIFDYFTRPTDRNARFGLGWNKMVFPDRIWEFGPYASPAAIAHTGWTGIDICIDPRYDLAVLLFTNRVHALNVPGDTNTFLTNDFAACSYGSIMSLVYESFLEK